MLGYKVSIKKVFRHSIAQEVSPYGESWVLRCRCSLTGDRFR